MKFHKFANDFRFSKHLCHMQNEIRSSNSFAQKSTHVDTNDIGSKEVNRLTQHSGLCSKPTNSPANNSQSIDHGCMGVGADQRIRIKNSILAQYSGREIFEIYLMHDSNPGGHNAKSVKGLHSPFQEFITLAISFELHLHVPLPRIRNSKDVYLNGMVNDEVNRHKRF